MEVIQHFLNSETIRLPFSELWHGVYPNYETSPNCEISRTALVGYISLARLTFQNLTQTTGFVLEGHRGDSEWLWIRPTANSPPTNLPPAVWSIRPQPVVVFTKLHDSAESEIYRCLNEWMMNLLGNSNQYDTSLDRNVIVTICTINLEHLMK
jgi:hypothetical protein